VVVPNIVASRRSKVSARDGAPMSGYARGSLGAPSRDRVGHRSTPQRAPHLVAGAARDGQSGRNRPVDVAQAPAGDDPSASSENPIAMVRQRRSPRFVIVDGCGEIVLASIDPNDDDWSGRVFSRDVAIRLVAEVQAHGSSDDLITLADPSTVVRATRLAGGSVAYYALFIEFVETRDLLKHAGERFGLSVREIDVLRLIMLGMDSAEIAGRLSIAKGTVHAHVKNIGRKTQSTKRTEILAKLLGVR
jgi:DNA-binding CsgD family transcriptional regulator